MTLRERGLQPVAILLAEWRVPWSWTPYKPQGSVATSASLPSDLTNTSDDLGKGWIATNTGYLHIWWGSGFDTVTNPATYNAKSVVTNIRARNSADALAKVQRLTLMQHTINPCSYGSPALGWGQP